jgi:hypothetical protein
MEEFDACFCDLGDPRDSNARHDLLDILVIGLSTMVCGCGGCTDMALFGRSKEGFLRQFLRSPHSIPSHDTFSRVYRLLDPVKFHTGFLDVMQRFGETAEGVVAIDGKTLRHSFDRAAGTSALHLISAWAAEQRLVLGHLTASTSAVPFSGEDWFDPLKDAIRFRVRAFIEALVGVALNTVWRFFERRGITLKKLRAPASKSVLTWRTGRRAWFEAQPDLDPQRLVFIDETSASTKMARRYDRSRRGTRCRAPVPQAHRCPHRRRPLEGNRSSRRHL